MIDDENTEELDEEGLEQENPSSNQKPKFYKSVDETRKEALMTMTPSEAEKLLTEFQRKLVHNIVYKSMTKATAARDAGSQAKSKEGLQNLAWETLRKPHVAAYMAYLTEKKNELAGIDKVEVIEGLRNIIQCCLTDAKYKDAIKAYELLGSAIGLFKTVSQSTSIKKPSEPGSSLLDDEGGEDGAKKDLTKLIAMIGGNQPSKKK